MFVTVASCQAGRASSSLVREPCYDSLIGSVNPSIVSRPARAGMGTASEETLGLYREGDSDGASGVTNLRGLLDLPEALGPDHDGKASAFVDYPDPSPAHLRPSHRAEKALCEPEGRPSSTP